MKLFNEGDHLLVIVCFFIVAMLVANRIEMKDKEVIIDCYIDDPDYPPAVKESCRIKRMNDEQNKKIPTYHT